MKNLSLKFILKLLTTYARKVLRIHKPFVIAITGSVGKTVTKEAVCAVLNNHFTGRVWSSSGNLNNEIGLLLGILGYEELPNKLLWPIFLVQAYFGTFKESYPKYLILELGIDRPGDMAFFSKILKPDLIIMTSVGGAHLQNFRSLSEYQAEKISLISSLKPEGKVLVNSDDLRLRQIKVNNLITIGISDSLSDYHIENYKVDSKGTVFRISTLGQKISIKTKLIGKQSIYSQLFAFAVGLEMGIQFLEIKKSLERMMPVNGRMRILQGIDNITIIDDTYNSNPLSARMAMDTLREMDYPGRKVVIIGNMNELGSESAREHANIGKYAKDKADFAVFVGENAALMAKSFDDSAHCQVFDSRESLLKSLDLVMKRGDIVLVKASQNGNYFEEIVKALLKDKTYSGEVLVRQNNYWLRKKKI